MRYAPVGFAFSFGFGPNLFGPGVPDRKPHSTRFQIPSTGINVIISHQPVLFLSCQRLIEIATKGQAMIKNQKWLRRVLNSSSVNTNKKQKEKSKMRKLVQKVRREILPCGERNSSNSLTLSPHAISHAICFRLSQPHRHDDVEERSVDLHHARA